MYIHSSRYNLFRLIIMRSWEEMKDFSYVGIKLTKAKTISEGLAKCKIDKLTRQNPVYQHLKVHTLLKGKRSCELCKSVDQLESRRQKKKVNSKLSLKSEVNLHNKSATQGLKEVQSARQRKHSYKILHKLRQLLEGNLQMQAFKKFDKFKGAIQKFDESVRRTKSQFYKIKGHSRVLNEYFLTEVNEIDREIHEDRTLAVAQVKSERMNMIEQYEKQIRKRGEVAKRVKEMRVPLKFPLNHQQIRAVVKDCREKQSRQASKLSSMLYSLYDYKAKANHAAKMKIVQQYTAK